MLRYPFTAVVGAPHLSLALLLTAIDPAIGGVLVRGEKGTAKSTAVRGLVEVLPPVEVVPGCRFSCSPTDPDPGCPDGPHIDPASSTRPTRLVELPVGATDDRVTGSLDLGRALGSGEAALQPGLLADAHRGLLYVDEVNLLGDHLVDVLLDAAAMGHNTVERDGVSVGHAARVVLVGTMNPEEGELRPQLLDRFGLSVEIAASRDPQVRTDVVRRRLAFDADPETFLTRWADAQDDVREQVLRSIRDLPGTHLSDWALRTIARVCAGFEVDGMRADLVIARAAQAHAAWQGHRDVDRADLRAAACLALPHRRRRGPFDPPGLDEDLLDRLLDEEPPPPPEEDPESPDRQDDSAPDGDPAQPPPSPPGQGSAGEPDTASPPQGEQAQPEPSPSDEPASDDAGDSDGTAVAGVASAGATYRPRVFTVAGVGSGAAGRRSRAINGTGSVIGSSTERQGGRVHLPATIVAAAGHQRARGRSSGPLRFAMTDVRTAVSRGRESNLVLFAVDASGSMAARRRMEEVKTAILSLLVDAYERRDRVGLVTFRGAGAELLLPPTSSVEMAARALDVLPHGGRTPLAEGLQSSALVLARERLRDPRRRALLVLVTDGRATAGRDALERSRRYADQWRRTGVDSVVIDCETGRFRMGLARDLALRMQAEHIVLEELAADGLLDVVTHARAGAA